MACYAAKKLACALVMCLVVVAPHVEAAINCATIATQLNGCISYLMGGPGPSAACCAGVKRVKAAAGTLADRKVACNCLKASSGSIKGLKLGLVSGLPRKCGVSISYTISPRTNCNAIH